MLRDSRSQRGPATHHTKTKEADFLYEKLLIELIFIEKGRKGITNNVSH